MARLIPVMMVVLFLGLMGSRDLVQAQSIFTVNSTGDGEDSNLADGICDDGTGNCTLRAAIEQANASSGLDTIAFNIPGAGPHTIQPTSDLSTITDPVVIDGYTQPGASPNTNSVGQGLNTVLKIELDGTNANANGLYITAGGTTVRGLLINRFFGYGVRVITNGGNVIEGNFIGTDVSGTADLGNRLHGVSISLHSPSNTIGGTRAEARHLISGNNQHAVEISTKGSSSNQIQGNLIGTDITGTIALGNSFEAIRIANSPDNTVGGTTPGARNIVSGNDGIGVNILGPSASGNLVQGNFIGTTVDGKSPLGNGAHGVAIRSAAFGNTIGGTASGAGNTIAFNGTVFLGMGVFVDSGVKNAVLSNSIFSNRFLGSDLGAVGVTPNDDADADSGPNNLQNFPVLTAAVSGRTIAGVGGMLDSTPDTAFTVQFFSNIACDPSGHGEGENFLGSAMVATDGSGAADFEATLLTTTPAGRFITATATDPGGNTSEFSQCIPLTELMAPAVEVGPDQTIEEGEAVSLEATFTDHPVTHTAVIDWGDGTAVAPIVNEAANTVSGSHAYPDDGIYTVLVTVSASEAGSGSDDFVVTVSNVPPVLDAGPDQTVRKGSSVKLPPAPFNDPGTLDLHTATIDWGDGTPVEEGLVSGPPFPFPDVASDATGVVWGKHEYSDHGRYDVMVCVNDDDGGAGCDSFRVSVPEPDPTLVGALGGSAQAVSAGTVGGTPYAFFGSGPFVVSADVTDPFNPLDVGRVLVPDLVTGLFFDESSGLIFVASFKSGLRVVDVSDPAAPVEVGRLLLPGVVRDLFLDESSGLIFVANGESGLRIVDVTDPTTPVEVGALDTPGNALGVTVAGGLAYVADVSGLRVVDVTDPAAPVEVGALDTPGSAYGVFIAGGLAYVAAGEGGLLIIDPGIPIPALPHVKAGPEQTTTVGETVDVTATFFERPFGGTHTSTIDWGDGAVEEAAVDEFANTPGGSHVYDESGIFPVVITVTDDLGNSDFDFVKVTVFSQPKAHFSGENISGMAPLEVSFTDESTGVPTQWAWDLGNGATSTEHKPTHTYEKAGDYTVSLAVTNPVGTDVVTKTKAIEVFEAPVARFGSDITSGMASLTVRFSDFSTGNIRQWTWTFGDGMPPATAQNPTHTYDQAGNYAVSLTVGNPAGTATIKKADLIEVFETPSATFETSVTSGKVPFTVAFTDRSTGNIRQWAWDFGDGSPPSTEQNPVHSYTRIGTYDVSLTATNPAGADSATRAGLITVVPGELDRIEPSTKVLELEVGQEFPFSLKALDAFGNEVSDVEVRWTMNVPQAGAMTAATGQFIASNTPGDYEEVISVRATIGSVTREASVTVKVYDKPRAEFSVSPPKGTVPLEIRFTDDSTGNITSWNWDLGDGTTNNQQHPVHTYEEPGTYRVLLTVRNPFGTDTVVKEALLVVTAILGDVNLDGGVDEADLSLVNGAYGTTRGGLEYLEVADVNDDKVIDLRDLAIVAANLGRRA